MKKLLFCVAMGGFALNGCATTPKEAMTQAKVESPALKSAIASESRAKSNRVRDTYRHPEETLAFFGIEPEMTVVEIWPGGGWYAEILAPYLKDKGQYVAAGFNAESEVGYFRKGSEKFKKLVASRSDDFGQKVKINDFEPPHKTEIIAPGTADAVLTFRNVHNWMSRDAADAAFKSFFTALKPGGILGVVEHRADASKPQDPKARSGYVREDVVIAMAEKAGFKLAAKSEINANSKDVKEYPKGVWTLPPVLALKEEDKAKYVAIGESDRMTLKFVKPE